MYKDFNVLFVEDENELRLQMGNILSLLFNKVFICEDGREGLESYKNNISEIDLVITDINMPRMDGIQMSEEIKKINSAIPIIITSAHSDAEYLLQAIHIGINGYVLKPMDFLEFKNTITKVLEPKILKKQLKEQEEENQEQLLKSAKFTAIGQLTAGLTHEINTPLTFIKGSAEMMEYLLDGMEQSKLKEGLLKQHVRINDGVKRLINIVESMREISKKSNEKFEQTNIYETIIIATVMAYNRAKHITPIYINNTLFDIDMDKNCEIFNACVQAQRVEQVWIIIINNAIDELIKISEFNDRRLDISIWEENQFIFIKFQDNAGGIEDEIFDHLFDAFKSTKESSGMGIGLSIAKKIIEEQEGEIAAYNENGGAVFEIMLPVECSKTLQNQL